MDNVNGTTQERIYTRLIEAVLLLSVCSIGALCHLAAFFIMVRHKVFRNPFGRLSACYAFSSASLLIVFLLWSVPWTIWDIPDNLHYLNLRMGQWMLGFYAATIHSSLFISINRFVAISFPIRYRTFFTLRTTYGLMAVIGATFVVNWSVALIDGCDYFYSHDYTYWAYGSEPCAQILQHYVNVQYGSCVAVAVAVIDSIVIVQLRLTNQKSISRMNGGQREAATRNMREFRFFMQSIACSGALLVLLVIYFTLAPLTTTNFQFFLCTTLAWASTHAISGAMLVVFNPEIRRHFSCKAKPSLRITVNITSVREVPHQTTSRAVFSARSS